MANISFSQEKVSWSFSYNIPSEELILEATIAEGWHLYSQNINQELGPVPTTFEFSKNEAIKIIGSTIEPEAFTEYDDNFGGELSFFKNQVEFKQKMKVSNSTSVKGVITYMICNETVCLPPKDVEFTVLINK
jgi:thiol:disulfide interchange protein DsbD